MRVDHIENISRQNRHHPLMLPVSVKGTVTRVGYYRDTLPQLIITVKKNDSMAIPFQAGARVPVPFLINGKSFTAGVRTTDRSATVMICPDLNDIEKNSVRLADLLYALGWDEKNNKVDLTIKDGVINIFPEIY